MANLAIKGHVTRGEEIIEILEMLGGKNTTNLNGGYYNMIYTINSSYHGEIIYIPYRTDVYAVFTLEEFLEKYPYKVGDKVYNIIVNKNQTITSLSWDSLENEVVYKTDNHNSYLYVDYLKPYKEAPIYLNEKANKQAEEIAEILEPAKEIMEEMKLDIPDGYEFFGIDDNKIVLTKTQPQYPKTYVECCGILDVEPYSRSAGYKSDLITAFRNLLICRDAYWKVAGDQLGLGKPWEPCVDKNHLKYVIQTIDNKVVCLDTWCQTRNILEFPTTEIRDVFYENFKDLIEHCVELL